MKKPGIHHVRYHAKKHQEAYTNLKNLLKGYIHTENVWPVFIKTFLLAIVSITIFLNWDSVISLFPSEEQITTTTQTKVIEPEKIKVHGYQSSTLSNYKVDLQSTDIYKRYMSSIPSLGHIMGIQTSYIIGQNKNKEITELKKETLNTSIWTTNTIGTGQHLTSMEQRSAQALQKSILTTFYIGEKTININRTLSNDTKLLSQINNALSVDIFKYLNQSNNRSNTLNNYLNLLSILSEKSNKRITELNSTVNFLQTNSVAKEQQINLSEDIFLENLKIFNGPNAETELGKFIGLQEGQTEIQAKMGAYKELLNYYNFFNPKLTNLIKEIKVNRDPLIAGVKVVEIDNMTLPIIIKQH